MLEVERKFIFKDDAASSMLQHILDKNPIFNHIADYYLSPSTRIREKQVIDAHTNCIMKTEYFLTIKSDGTLERYEFEYKLGEDFKLPLGCLPRPVQKNRFFYKEGELTYEINYFNSDLTYEQGWQLVICEVELDKLTREIPKQSWLGEEITENKMFYGHELSKILNEGKVITQKWKIIKRK